MFRNQYLITDKKELNVPQNFNRASFEGLEILSEKNLNIKIVKNKNSKICLIGFLLDPFYPDKNEEQILFDLLSIKEDKNDFFFKTENYSGRFILVCSFTTEFFIVGDAFHSRQIIYSKTFEYKVITSSHNLFYYLFNEKPEYHPEIKKILDTPLAKTKESDWYGNKTLDMRFLKLLPNRYLNLNSSEYARIPIKNYNEDYNKTIDIVNKILIGTYKSIIDKYKLIQPLTSGWDSRVLLSSSLPFKDKITYYIFSRPNNQNSADISIPKSISKKLKFDFKVWETEKLTKDFNEKYKENNLIQNFLPKTSDIQFHYFNHKSETLNVSGVGGDVIRMFYGKKSKILVGFKDLLFMTPYFDKIPFVNNEILIWYNESKDYAVQNNLQLLDLFYIENRLANWGSIYSFEQDIAIEELKPFNNKRLIYSILRISPEKRAYPKFQVFRDLIELNEKKLLNFKFNPDKNKIKEIFKSNFSLFLLSKKILKYLK